MRAAWLPTSPTGEPRPSSTGRDTAAYAKSLPKRKHAAEHNAEPAPLMMEHAWLRSATTRHWRQDFQSNSKRWKLTGRLKEEVAAAPIAVGEQCKAHWLQLGDTPGRIIEEATWVPVATGHTSMSHFSSEVVCT